MNPTHMTGAALGALLAAGLVTTPADAHTMLREHVSQAVHGRIQPVSVHTFSPRPGARHALGGLIARYERRSHHKIVGQFGWGFGWSAGPEFVSSYYAPAWSGFPDYYAADYVVSAPAYAAPAFAVGWSYPTDAYIGFGPVGIGFGGPWW